MKKQPQSHHKGSTFKEKLYSIKSKLIGAFLVTVVPIILLGVFSYKSSVASLSDTAQKTSIETIKQVTNFLEMKFDSVDVISRQLISDKSYSNYLSTVSGDMNWDSISAHSDLTNTIYNYIYNNKTIHSIVLLLKNNKTISTTGITFKPGSYEKVEDTDLVKKVKSNMGAAVWVGYHSEIDEQMSSGHPNYALSQIRLARNYVMAEDCGVLIINLHHSFIDNVIDSVNLGENSEIHLISPDNRDIAYRVTNDQTEALDTSLAENQVFSTDFFGQILNAEDVEGTLTAQYKGSKHIVLYSRVGESGYTVVGLVPTANFTASAASIGIITLVFTIIAVIFAIGMGLFMAMSMGRTINRIIDASKKVIEGDLTIEFRSRRKDELGILSFSLNQMIGHMRNLIKETAVTAAKVDETAKTVANTSEQVTLVSHEVTKTIQEISGGATAQAADSEQGVLKMRDLANNIQAVSERAKTIEDYSSQTISLTKEGLVSVEDLENKAKQTTEIIHAIINDTHALDENSQTIRNIVKVIHGIADQTNLLSLNAAIEAARAGETGRGFAVVADEIRKLAEQATSATQEIGRIIDNTLKQTSRVVEWAESSENILNSQNEAVTNVSEVFDKITRSMEQLVTRLEEIAAGIVDMNYNKEQTLTSIHNISSVSQQIAASTEEVAASTQEQLSSIEELSSYAKELENVAKQLNESIKRFKV
jgi:methyl-accepting chemotaxis protein